MGAAVIQKKIYNAYAKVAQKLGYDYDIYRPITYLDPISLENWVNKKKLSTAPSDSFGSAQKFSIPILNAFIDGNILQVGDMLFNEDQNRTFFVISMQPHLPINVIEAPNRITIKRTSYADNAGSFEKVAVTIASGVPANIDVPNAAAFSNGIPSQVGTGQPKWLIYAWLPDQTISIGDVITDENGNTAVVQSVNWSPLGYQIHCVEPSK